MAASAKFIDYACDILVKYLGRRRAKDLIDELRVGPSQNASVRATLELISRRLSR